MVTTTQNDDLLVISEDANDTLLDEPMVEETISENDVNNLITFDTEIEEKSENKANTNKTENVFDISSDFNITEDNSEETNLEFNITEDNSEETNLEEDTSNNKTDSSLDFGDLSLEETETMVEETKQDNESSSFETNVEDTLESTNSSVGTMEDILSNTINQLTLRSDIIEDGITAEQDIISDLKVKITDLETKVKESEDKVSKLRSEKTMISKNIKSLEKMKEINVTSDLTKETSTKVHNTKRRKAS